VAVLFLAACASKVPGTEGGRVEIELVQLSTVPAAARHVSGGAPIQYNVRVGNRTGDTITLQQIQLQTVSDVGPYVIQLTTKPYDVKIPSNEFRDVEMWAPSQLTGSTLSGANSPATLRLTLRFDSTAGVFQETVIRQAHAAVTSRGD
jgi:hypothetical protein